MLYQLPSTFRAESTIATRLAILSAVPSALPSIRIPQAIEWAKERAGFAFDPVQTQAIESALSHKLSILTGGPGTGKTTILRAIVDILKAKKVQIVLTAPTGRAAQRMSESARHFAQTLHRLLKFDTQTGHFTFGEANPLKTDFVIVDESSMLDTKLAAALFKAIPPHAHVLLVGDTHQLPSVGPGNILKDFIHSNRFQVTYLTTIFRQQTVSRIVTTAHSILQGQSATPGVTQNLDTLNPHHDLHFIQALTPESCIEHVTALHSKYIPRWFQWADPIMDLQVLAPMHKGSAGIGNLNHILQSTLNTHKTSLTVGSIRFQVGDKVIQTRNNYDKNIFNGDLGCIESIQPEAGTLSIQFDDQLVTFERMELGDLSLAYAMSIHKSQGSEFPIVIVPLLKQHFIMLQRNLLYTAITRGRKKVFIVGDPAAYAMAVRNQESAERQTHLCQKIMAQG